LFHYYATEDSQLRWKLPNREVRRENLAKIRATWMHTHEAVSIFQQIELEGWGWAQSLCFFPFFHNIFYLVHFYATEDSQLHWKLPNREVR
jgi:hypothetical protein